MLNARGEGEEGHLGFNEHSKFTYIEVTNLPPIYIEGRVSGISKVSFSFNTRCLPSIYCKGGLSRHIKNSKC